MAKPLILYHGNCYDGFGAAWAAWKKFGDDAEYRPMLYGDKLPFLVRDYYILDFSFPRQELNLLQAHCGALRTEVVLLDHHKTAEDDLRGFDFCTFDMNSSGAVLAWRYFHTQPVPRVLEYVQDRDLWRFMLPESREIDCFIKSTPFDFPSWDALADLLERRFDHCVKLGHGAKLYQSAMVYRMADNAWMKNIGGWDVPVTNATVFYSEVGEELLKLYPQAMFAAYYTDRKDGKRQWGLRSRPGFDCSAVAKMYGGGGHPQAAGFVEERP